MYVGCMFVIRRLYTGRMLTVRQASAIKQVSLELCLLYLSAQRMELSIKALTLASQQQVLKTFPGLCSVGLVMFRWHLNVRKYLVVETVPSKYLTLPVFNVSVFNLRG